MKKMKKVITLLLAVMLIVSLSACTKKPGEVSEPNQDKNDTPKQEDVAVETKWPEKNISIIVPYPSGGSTDLTMRTLSQELTRSLGKNVVVINKEGGGGSVGASECAVSKPDGYTFTVANGANMSVVPRGADIGYTYKSFTPISQVSNTPLALAVHKNFPVDTLEEFIQWSKDNPGKMRFSSAGANSTQQLTMDILGEQEGFEALHIANNGAGPAVAACLGEHVEAVVALTTDLVPGFNSGELKIITVFADERVEEFGDVPSSKELGYDNLSFGVWYALVGPAGLPTEIVEKLDNAIKEALETEFIVDAYAKMKIKPVYLNHEELTAKMEQVDTMFGNVLDGRK